jgi:hypothetical protein
MIDVLGTLADVRSTSPDFRSVDVDPITFVELRTRHRV